MKKNILLSLTVLLIAINVSYSQLGEMTAIQLTAIKKSKTYVVLDNEADSKYNAQITTAMKQFWKLTPYEFIKQSQLNDYIHKKDISLILKSTIQDPYNYSSNSVAKRLEMKQGVRGPAHDAVVLTLGGLKSGNLEFKDWLAYFLVDEAKSTEHYYFLMGEIVQSIQYFVEVYEASGSVHKLTLKHLEEVYNKNMQNLQTKTLLIPDNELPQKFNSNDEIKKLYPYSSEIASKDKIISAISGRDKNSVILKMVYSGGLFYYHLFDVATGKIIFLKTDTNYINDADGTIKKVFMDIAK